MSEKGKDIYDVAILIIGSLTYLSHFLLFCIHISNQILHRLSLIHI